MCIYLQVLQEDREDHGDPLDPVETDRVKCSMATLTQINKNSMAVLYFPVIYILCFKAS